MENREAPFVVRNAPLALALSLLGLAVLTAQTPTPSASAAPASGKPMRHLEYSFSVSTQGLESYEFNGINGGSGTFNGTNGGVETTNGAGNVARSIGGNGTMFVDILSVAADGALVVRISELVQNEPRPRAAFTCTVYGSTSVICPSVPAPSQAEWVLLAYLGRQFVDGEPWDASGHWQRKESSAQFEIDEAFTLVDAGNGKKVVVSEVKKTTLHNGGFANQTSNVTINYDRAMEVPDVIRDDVETAGGNEASHAHYVFTLTRDSFAKPTH